MGKERYGTVQRFFVSVPLVSPAKICPVPVVPQTSVPVPCPKMPGFVVPRDFSSGTVPQIFVPVPTFPWLWVPVPVPIIGICGTGPESRYYPGTTAHSCPTSSRERFQKYSKNLFLIFMRWLSQLSDLFKFLKINISYNIQKVWYCKSVR